MPLTQSLRASILPLIISTAAARPATGYTASKSSHSNQNSYIPYLPLSFHFSPPPPETANTATPRRTHQYLYMTYSISTTVIVIIFALLYRDPVIHFRQTACYGIERGSKGRVRGGERTSAEMFFLLVLLLALTHLHRHLRRRPSPSLLRVYRM